MQRCVLVRRMDFCSQLVERGFPVNRKGRVCLAYATQKQDLVTEAIYWSLFKNHVLWLQGCYLQSELLSLLGVFWVF